MDFSAAGKEIGAYIVVLYCCVCIFWQKTSVQILCFVFHMYNVLFSPLEFTATTWI